MGFFGLRRTIFGPGATKVEPPAIDPTSSGGVSQAYVDAAVATKSTSHGEYQAGLVVKPSDLVMYFGVLYISVSATFTTSGNWSTDQSAFQAVGVDCLVWKALVYWNAGSPYATVNGANTIGEIVVSDGGAADGSDLTLTLAGAFPAGKTHCFAGSAQSDINGDPRQVLANRLTTNAIYLSGNPNLDVPIDGCPVRIEVYP